MIFKLFSVNYPHLKFGSPPREKKSTKFGVSSFGVFWSIKQDEKKNERSISTFSSGPTKIFPPKRVRF